MEMKSKEMERQVKDLSANFIDAADGYPHQVFLEALINTYIWVAKSHSCCTQAAANAAMTASLLLAQHSATHPQHPIH